MIDPTDVLPHRPPFLFIDTVDELVAGQSVTCSFHVREDLDVFAGHFPGQPVFPGVLQLEALAQAGAIAVLTDPAYAGKLPLFGGVEEVRWRRQVGPGDTLTLAVEMERLSARGGWGKGVAKVDGKPACAARLFFVLA